MGGSGKLVLLSTSHHECFHKNRVYFQIAIVGVLSHDVLLVAQITPLAVITSLLSLADATADRYVNQALSMKHQRLMMSLELHIRSTTGKDGL